MKWVPRLAAFGLAAVFFYAGFVKMGTSERFAITVAQFTILPPVAVSLVAPLLGWGELLVAMLLAIPRTTRAGAALAATLLVTFIASLAWALSQGIVVDCGCFGEDPVPSRGKMIAAIGRDIGLLAVSLWLTRRPPRPTRPGPEPD